jgi:hypothetical protein
VPADPAALFTALLATLGEDPGAASLLPLTRRLHAVSVIGTVFQLAYDPEELLADEVRALQQPDTVTALREAFARVAPDCTLVLKRWIASVSDDQRAARRRATEDERQRVEALPFVREVCAAVGGQVIDVRVPGPDPRRGER